ncbi:putative integral peroxisomal membrane peroxin protein [Rosellinia necatrix]|uniref:Putative integral peroxisomal membrane peroxin protein n=1 Tax=Rosellinia necatrix TaxID=77044 RepID=A0A1S7UIN6_ROSNE|nr:putative integral peroxisomal membrane peroxin protein [Rosellinia necatrix]
MGDENADSFVNRDDPIPTIILNTPSPRPETPTPSGSHKRSESRDTYQSDVETPTRSGGIRGRISALKEKARIQDHLVEKLLAQVVPLDDGAIPQDDSAYPDRAEKPNFTLPTMSNNFRRFNARIGVVFVFQARVVRLLAWRRPTHTLSFLAVYTFVCLDPALLLPLLPLVILLVSVLVPSFVARHPAADFSPPSGQTTAAAAAIAYPYSAPGPPVAPAVTVKPVKELSRDFFHNMRDLQNCMEDFSQLHDAVVKFVVPWTNFSDEARSSALSVAVFAAAVLVSVAANAIPWRLLFLAGGWAVTCAGHPAVQRRLEAARETTHGGGGGPPQRPAGEEEMEMALTWVGQWIARDVILDSAPETREVEIFELQRLSGPAAGEWEPWLFSGSPYDPLSPARLAGDRPAGTRFFEDVRPPRGWEWSEKKWALDLWSREWVEERIITGVEIETEGERWVYDIYDEQAAAAAERVGVVVDGAALTLAGAAIKVDAAARRLRPSWEEGEDGEGRRGEWRRRRWVRLVKRKYISRDAVS